MTPEEPFKVGAYGILNFFFFREKKKKVCFVVKFQTLFSWKDEIKFRMSSAAHVTGFFGTSP